MWRTGSRDQFTPKNCSKMKNVLSLLKVGPWGKRAHESCGYSASQHLMETPANCKFHFIEILLLLFCKKLGRDMETQLLRYVYCLCIIKQEGKNQFRLKSQISIKQSTNQSILYSQSTFHTVKCRTKSFAVKNLCRCTHPPQPNKHKYTYTHAVTHTHTKTHTHEKRKIRLSTDEPESKILS